MQRLKCLFYAREKEIYSLIFSEFKSATSGVQFRDFQGGC